MASNGLYSGGCGAGAGVDSRYKLSKPKSRAPIVGSQGPVMVPFESKTDLDTSSTSEPAPILSSEQNNTLQSGHSVRQSVRGSMYGIRQRPGKNIDSEEEEDIEVKPTRKKRFSMTNTAVGKRSSMRMSLGLSRSSTVDANDISTEISSDEDMNNTVKKKILRDKIVALNQPSETTVDDNRYEERFLSPIRRRSFFTPGLATRNPVDVLAKPPKPSKKDSGEFDYYYNPNLSSTSPLERIVALDLANRPTTPFARASTPGDLDYGLIGTLRITNGAVSPASSARSGYRKTSAGLRHSAGNPLQTEMDIPSLPKAHRDTELTHDIGQFQEQQTAGMTYNELRSHADIPGPITIWPTARDSCELGFQEKRATSYSAISQADTTLLAANDYIMDIADNPFDPNSPFPAFTSTFEATTKPSEVEDELFDENPLRQQSSFESLHSGDLVLPDLMLSEDEFSHRTSRLLERIGRSTSTLDKTCSELSATNNRVSMCKVDSGYDSSSSTRSYRNEQGHNVSVLEIAKQRQRSSAQDQVDPQATIRVRRRPTPVTILTSSTNNDSVFSRPMHTSNTIMTMSTTASTTASTSKPSTPKKLKKPRPQSQPPTSNRVSIQMHPDIDPENVPYVPEELTNRMARRVADLPPLDHTLPSVGHLRLESVDLKLAPLSAPLRFPSPTPTIDRVWDQAMGFDPKRPKPARKRHSFLGVLQPKKSAPNFSSRSDAHVMTLGDVHGLIGQSPYDFINMQQEQPKPVRSTPVVAPRVRPTMPRAKSMIGMSDYEAAEVSRRKSIHRLANPDPPVDHSRVVRRSSSIYPTSTPATTASVWTDASPDLRHNSSICIPNTRSTPALDSDAALSADTNNMQLPASGADYEFAIANQSPKPCASREPSPEERFDDRGGIPGQMPLVSARPKDLPPLPMIPVATQVKIHEENVRKANSVKESEIHEENVRKANSVKKSATTKKNLPPLPHQRKVSKDIIPRGLSPCRESGFWLSASENISRQAQAAMPANASEVIENKQIAALRRPARMRSEPPSLAPSEWQASRLESQRSSTPTRQPTLPVLSRASSPRRGVPGDDRRRATRTQSPEHAAAAPWTSKGRTHSPDRLQHKWLPPRAASPERRHTERPRYDRPSPHTRPQEQQSGPRHAPIVPQGLVARMSGRFEGGLGYNYEPGYGIAGSAGTRNSAVVRLRKSVDVSRGHGLDLTDVPIFVAHKV